MFYQYVSKNKAKITLILFILLVTGIAVMRYLDSFLTTEMVPNGIVSFELAKESSVSAAMIGSWDIQAKAAAGISLGFDYLFMLFYASFLAMLVLRVNERLLSGPAGKRWNKLLISAPFIAAFFDMIENVALIRLLLGDLQQTWSLMAFYAATIKFTILFIVIVYILFGGVILIFKRKNQV
ncbi:MAG: hypothetical protein DSY82_04110 [Flavobacteriia bacterium]|nr:MAG: hypothetical protein DSY82_04110 [Flavobacteriia bacterium]